MIQIHSERLIPIPKVPAYLESRGFHRVHISAVYRWTKSGSRGVRLESLRIGGQKVTSIEAIQRFIEATTRNSTGGSLPPSKPTSRQREAAIRKAERDLAKAGI